MGRDRHLLYVYIFILLNYLLFPFFFRSCASNACAEVQTAAETSNRIESELNGGQFTLLL